MPNKLLSILTEIAIKTETFLRQKRATNSAQKIPELPDPLLRLALKHKNTLLFSWQLVRQINKTCSMRRLFIVKLMHQAFQFSIKFNRITFKNFLWLLIFLWLQNNFFLNLNFYDWSTLKFSNIITVNFWYEILIRIRIQKCLVLSHTSQN